MTHAVRVTPINITPVTQGLIAAGLSARRCESCAFTVWLRSDIHRAEMPPHSCAKNQPSPPVAQQQGITMGRPKKTDDTATATLASGMSAEARATLTALHTALGEALGLGATLVESLPGTTAAGDPDDVMGILSGAGTAAATTADDDDPVMGALGGSAKTAPAKETAPAAPTHADFKKVFVGLQKSNKAASGKLAEALAKTYPDVSTKGLTAVPEADLPKWIAWAGKQKPA